MNWTSFENKFEKGWGEKLRPFIESKECDEIYKFLKERSRLGHKILPNSNVIYRAFQECAYKDLKVVIIGQDPYPYFFNGVETADGLAFSCGNTKKLQPSLDKFYEGMENDLANGLDLSIVKEPDLTFLAKQGVLLLNSALTVEKDKVGSHSNIDGHNIWEPFFKYLIEEVLNNYNPGLCFILLGKQAEMCEKYILPFNHYIFTAEHPSFAARKERPWKHDHVFSCVNHILEENNKFRIDWYDSLPF
jgi:uracil-DNA glycosylase